MGERIRRCWQGHRDQFEVGTDEYIQSWIDYPDGATCLLPEGHEGPHEWTPDDQILISFSG